MDLFEIDKKISEIGKKLNFYSFLTPVNQIEERMRFFDAVSRGEAYDPVFEYRKTELAWAFDELSELKSNLSRSGVMARILGAKLDFIMSSVALLGSGDEGLAESSVKLFGRPDEGCIKEAIEIASSRDVEVFTEETVTPEAMRTILESYIREKGLDWQVRLSSKMVPKITVSGAEGVLYINSKMNYTPQEVERLKVHEVEVHVFRGANGKRQPYRIFSEGTAGYNETEEGLAIINEERRGVLELDRRQIRLYAGRAICAELCLEMGFYDAFRHLTEYFPEYIAYRLVERAKRGLRETRRRGALTKGYHYISGLQKIRKYLAGGGDIELLYIGKVAVEDIEEVKMLLDEGVLEKARYLPDE